MGLENYNLHKVGNRTGKAVGDWISFDSQSPSSQVALGLSLHVMATPVSFKPR